MNMNSLLSHFLATDNPLLPSSLATRVALPVIWALVLGSTAGLLACTLVRPYRLAAVVCVMVWTLLPGSVSPAYWLGLAFQTPSLTSGAMGLVYLFTLWRREPVRGLAMAAGEGGTLHVLTISAVVLGWVLLLDTLAWLPVSVYAGGFGSAACALMTVSTVLLWALSGGPAAPRSTGLRAPALMLVVLTLFVLTRLPTGNVWDALLDPWLWVALQVLWLFRAVCWVKTAWRRSPPIRA